MFPICLEVVTLDLQLFIPAHCLSFVVCVFLCLNCCTNAKCCGGSRFATLKNSIVFLHKSFQICSKFVPIDQLNDSSSCIQRINIKRFSLHDLWISWNGRLTGLRHFMWVWLSLLGLYKAGWLKYMYGCPMWVKILRSMDNVWFPDNPWTNGLLVLQKKVRYVFLPSVDEKIV